MAPRATARRAAVHGEGAAAAGPKKEATDGGGGPNDNGAAAGASASSASRVRLSPEIAAEVTLSFLRTVSQMILSTGPPRQYLISTAFVCEIRWTRSSACTRSDAFQESSANTTSEAAVSVSPCDAAQIDSSATRVPAFLEDVDASEAGVDRRVAIDAHEPHLLLHETSLERREHLLVVAEEEELLGA